jgi:hypothetical protein
MYNWDYLIRQIELQDAVNFLGASRKQYNKNTGEGLSFKATFDMIDECSCNVGTNKDFAMMKAIRAHIEEELALREAELWKQLSKQVELKTVNRMLKDDMLFEDSDEYQMTDEEAAEYYGDEYEAEDEYY